MAIYKSDIVNINLESGNIFRSFLNNSIGHKDDDADRFGIRAFRDGEPVDLSGLSCQAVFMAPNGVNIALTSYGTVSGNEAYVTLPPACYDYEGQFCLAIKLVGGGVTSTVRIVDGVVERTGTSGAVAPTSAVPTYQEILSVYDDMVAATSAANLAIAEEFDATKAYPAGKFLINDGALYRLTSDHAAGTTWANTSKVSTNFGDEVSGLKSAVINRDISDFAEISGKIIDESGVISNNSYIKLSDYIYIPNNAISVTGYIYYTKPSDSSLKTYHPLCVFYGSDKSTVIGYIGYSNHVNGYKTGDIPQGAKYVRFNQSQLEADKNNILFRFNFVDKEKVSEQIDSETPLLFGYVGHYNGTFTETESLDTGILLEANQEYHIVNKTSLTKPINVYRSGNANAYKRIISASNEIDFANDSTAGNLMLYNVNGNLDSVSIDVYKKGTVSERATHDVIEYSVSKNNLLSDYTSLTQCLLDLKDDETEKVIHIYGGDYDIFQEYEDANVPVYSGDDPTGEYFDYCVWIPKNTHIIGHGLVRLIYMPEASQTNYNQARTVSPLNVAATATIENIEVHCKNGRYCLHNDSLDKAQFENAVQRFINCKFYKYIHDTDEENQNLGTIHTTGFGIGACQFHEYINCEFYNEDSGRAFYGHATQQLDGSNISLRKSSEIKLVNCIMDTVGTVCVKLGNVSNSNLHIRTRFNNCYFSGRINVEKEGGTVEKPNVFDVLFQNCGEVSVYYADPDNQYSPKAYNTELTILE